MIARSFLLLAVVLGCSVCHGDEAVEIPLSEIWGYRIPGTRNIEDLEPETNSSSLTREESLRGSLVHQIRRSLNSNRRHQNQRLAGASFVVVGTNSEALKNAHAVLVAGESRSETFSKNDELTLVFYCYEYGRYVRLDNVLREENEIRVQYHFLAHNTLNMSTHFALIPLGKMSSGTVNVRIEQLSEEGPDWGPSATAIDPDMLRQIVCSSATFKIQ